MDKILKYLLLVVVLLSLYACGEEANSEQPITQKQEKILKEKEKSLPAQPTEEDMIMKILKDYYVALENESVDIADFYAPVIEKFYGADSFHQDAVLRSLKQSFKSVENRKVEVDWESLTIQKKNNLPVVSFRGTTSFTEVKTGKTKNASFYNQLTFDEDLRILRYEDAEKARAVEQVQKQVESAGEGQLLQTITIIKSALRKGQLNKIEGFIHPEYGCYLLNKPGAITIPYYCTYVSDFEKNASWISKGFSKLCTLPRKGQLPTFTCNTQFSKDGCWFDKLDAPYTGISDLMATLNRIKVSRLEVQPQEQIQAFQKKISHQMIDTATGMSIHLGMINGKWYMMILDVATYNCSA
ncbi:MAG: hypothetical protein AAFY71_23405 [Bacteroidota bacterium]